MTPRKKLGAFSTLVAGFATAIALWGTGPAPYVDHHPEMRVPAGAAGASLPRSSKWPTVRSRFLREHPVCEACGTGKDLNVHHIIPFHEAPHLELVEANMITLCRRDHLRIGHYCGHGKSNWGLCSNPRVREDAAAERRRRSH